MAQIDATRIGRWMMPESDLREKISDMLDEWRSNIVEDTVAHDWGRVTKTHSSTYDIAGRILALLPKVPELRWKKVDDAFFYYIGDFRIGRVYEHASVWFAWVGEFRHGFHETDEQARAAVEAAVLRALGWEA